MFRIRNIKSFVEVLAGLSDVFAPDFDNTGVETSFRNAATGIACAILPIGNSNAIPFNEFRMIPIV